MNYELFDHPRYKYRLTSVFVHVLSREWPWMKTEWFGIQGNTLVLPVGYAWDGPSGPAIDTANFLRASLVHDSLYQAIAAGYIDKRPWKARADKELRRVCKQDGMGALRRAWVYGAVRIFGRAQQRYEG